MKTATLLTFMLAAAAPLTASANVITDWDDIAVKTIQPPGPVAPINVDLTYRASALVEVAMFNAVDCIEPKYHPYGMQVEPSPELVSGCRCSHCCRNCVDEVGPQ